MTANSGGGLSSQQPNGSSEVKRGSIVYVVGAHGWPARVMAVAEGYVMARYKGAMPFVASLKELSLVPVGTEGTEK